MTLFQSLHGQLNTKIRLWYIVQMVERYALCLCSQILLVAQYQLPQKLMKEVQHFRYL